jgi:hypothetical protein
VAAKVAGLTDPKGLLYEASLKRRPNCVKQTVMTAYFALQQPYITLILLRNLVYLEIVRNQWKLYAFPSHVRIHFQIWA